MPHRLATCLLFVVGVAALALAPRAILADAPEAGRLVPERTFAVIVGVLEWERPGFAPFSKANRKDQELFDALIERGVPRKNLRLLLDADATRDAIYDAVRETAKAAPADSTFLFYYAGHGARTKGRFHFANYDAGGGDPDGSMLALTRLAEILDRNFSGRRVLFLADCCHSGGLCDVAKSLATERRQAAALTSVLPEGLSTSNWTFTETILDGLRGRGLYDRNADGRVSLGELAAEVDGAMRHLERQRCGFASFGLAGDFELAPAKRENAAAFSGDDPFRLGQFVRARDSTGWVTGRLVGRDGDLWRVELQAYATRSVLRVATRDLQQAADPFPPDDGAAVAELPPGVATEALVKWGDQWWPALIVGAKDDGSGEVRIHYLGWSSDHDEWVGPDRVVAAEVKLTDAEILVEWGGAWWPARVLSREAKQTRVRFVGWSEQWDETVAPKRIRPLK